MNLLGCPALGGLCHPAFTEVSPFWDDHLISSTWLLLNLQIGSNKAVLHFSRVRIESCESAVSELSS